VAQNTNTVLRDRIDRYLEELDELIVLIGEKGVLTPTQKSLAGRQMKSLKERMRADRDPGVFKAILHFHSAWNTDPIKSKWIHQLGDVQSDLTLYRHRTFGLRSK
jgi:hypothetical protein